MSVPFPDSSSTPSQIRRYLRHVLITKHELSPEVATETADRWQYGRGQDFLNTSVEALSRFCGKDLGPCLYNTICEDEARVFRYSIPGQIYHYGHYIGILTLLTPIWQAYQTARVADCFFRLFILLLANAAFHLWFGLTRSSRIEGTSPAWFFSFLVLAFVAGLSWAIAVDVSEKRQQKSPSLGN